MLIPKSPPVGTDPVTRASIMAAIGRHSQIVSVASASARNALAATIVATVAEPLWVYRQDTSAVEVTTNGTAWKTMTPSAGGRVAKTSAQGVSDPGAWVSMVDDWRTGGVGYATDRGGGLIIPHTGPWLVSASTYWTGPSAAHNVARVSRIRGATATDVMHLIGAKGIDDLFIGRTDILSLEAGDRLHIYAISPASLWGDAMKSGTGLSITAI